MFDAALEGTPCVPWIAPTDVILSKEDIVQPDLFVVCDPKKLTDKNVQGAPDVIIEVLSPYTAKKDRWEKRKLYEKYGVLEYILVDPDGLYIERFLLKDNGQYAIGEILGSQETLTIQNLLKFKFHYGKFSKMKAQRRL